MNPQKTLATAACAALASASALGASVGTPNILMILVDDLGYGDLSCQGVAEDVRTPHIDRLLNEGIRCTNFHANCPVSSPSRASLLTGRYPDLVGVPGVIRTRKEVSWGFLSPDAVLLPQMLRQQGYESAIIGKWHLGLSSPNTPRERGFDYFRGFLGDMMDDYYTHLRKGNNYMRENETVINPQGHATELFTDWAAEYVTKKQEEQTPFFLYLAYNAPHTPVQPPKEWLEKVRWRERGISEKRAKLVALIEHLDDNIGRLYRVLEKNKQLENTLIIFSSDNGGQADVGANNKPHRGAKEDMFEGGICVPAGFYWKGRISPAINDNFVMLSDIFPTLCELTGTPVEHEIDGMSVLPLLHGETQVTDDRVVYWVRREGGPRYRGRAYYAARYKQHKLMQNTPWEPLVMFDMAQDPAEENPITNKSSAQYKQLFGELMQHIRKSGAVPWQSGEDVR